MDHLQHKVIGFPPRNSMSLLNLCKFFDIHKNLYTLTTHSAKKYLPSFAFNMASFASFFYCMTEISFQVRASKKFLWIIGCFPLKKETSSECTNPENFFQYFECIFQNFWRSQMYQYIKSYVLKVFDQVLPRRKKPWILVLFISLRVYRFRSLSVTDKTKTIVHLNILQSVLRCRSLFS